jgi:hypothetical protein
MPEREDPHSRNEELASRLRELQERFDRMMRARGFDPAQAQNSALTSELADLFAAIQELRSELDEAAEQERVGQEKT